MVPISPIRSLIKDKLLSQILGIMGLECSLNVKPSLIMGTQTSEGQIGIFSIFTIFEVGTAFLCISYARFDTEG